MTANIGQPAFFHFIAMFLPSESQAVTIDMMTRVGARDITIRIYWDFGSLIVTSNLSRVNQLPRPQKRIGHSQGHSRILGT